MRKNGFDNNDLRQDGFLNNINGKDSQGEDYHVINDPEETHGKKISVNKNFGEENYEKNDSRNKSSREESSIKG